MKWLARIILVILGAIPVLALLTVLILGNWALFHGIATTTNNQAWLWLEIPAFVGDIAVAILAIGFFFAEGWPWLVRTAEWNSRRPRSDD